ncbi:MAG: hypothetical protein CMJ83_17680 [Planctomycetes bacterium]|nr:hypothetical protein [Planctomycetota bacterium]
MHTVIIRRPHAYTFARDHSGTPIPGLAVLDSDGTFIGGITLPSKDVGKRLAALSKGRKRVERDDEPEAARSFVRWHVIGMKKTASGAT